MTQAEQNVHHNKRAARALRTLLSLDRTTLGRIGVILAANVDDHVHYRWLSLEQRDDTEDNGRSRSAAVRFRSILAGSLKDLDARVDPETPRLSAHRAHVAPADYELQYVDLKAPEAGHLRTLLEPLSAGTPFAPFAGEDTFIDNLRFYLIDGVLEGQPLRCFRLMSPKIELSRSRRFAIMGDRKGGAYDLVEDKVLLFDDGVDCLQWGSWIFLLHRTAFQQMFGYYGVLEAQKDEVLDRLEDLDIIHGMDDLRRDARGIAKWTKLGHIAETGVLSSAAEPPPTGPRAAGEPPAKPEPPEGFWERVSEVIELFELKVRVVGSGDDRKLVYDADYPWEIYHLLADDYLVSPQAPQPTRRGYRSLEKRLKPLRHAVEVVRSTMPAAEEPSRAAADRKGPRRTEPAAGEVTGTG